MNLKSIELTNFQAHAFLKIDFTSGINVLVGESGVGKSCVRRAIEWCLFNHNIDGIRTEGTKKTSVKIALEDDTIIERIRSTSINRYILSKNGEEKIFDSIGKTIPEEVKDAIGLNTIEVDGEELYLNSAHQIALPFLFDKSPSWRMKLFNKLTGNDLLDKLFVQFNKDILRINRTAKEDTERLEKTVEKLSVKEVEKEQIEAVHQIIKKEIETIRVKKEKYDKYISLLELQQNNKSSLKKVNEQKRTIVFPQDIEIEELTVKVNKLENNKSLLKAVLSNEKDLSSVSTLLSQMSLPSVDVPEIEGKIHTLDTLKLVFEKQKANSNKKSILLNNIIEQDLVILNNQLDELLAKTKQCPVCNQELTEECIKELRS